VAEAKKTFPIPKTEAQVADRWYTVMQERLALQKQVDALAAEEAFLKAHIIDTLPRSKATGIAGKLVQVNIADKVRGEIKDFDAFSEFIAKNRKKGAFALLNRALNVKSCTEYWDAGKEVPGVAQVPYKTLSYSRLA
jgi:hypothetical protein